MKFHSLTTCCIIALTVMMTSACKKEDTDAAQQQSTTPVSSITSIVQTPNATGNYLSARSAFAKRDFAKALEYTTASLSQFPTNSTLLQQAFFLNIIAQRWQVADDIAQRILSTTPDDYFANLVLITKSVTEENYTLAEQQLNKLPQGALQQLWLSLYQAWISLGQGSGQQASYVLQAVDQVPELRPLILLHNGLINQIAGNIANAINYFAQAKQSVNSLPIRFIVLYGNLLNAQKQTVNIAALLENVENDGDSSHLAKEITERLQTGNTAGLGIITSAKEGFGQALYDVGTFLNGDHSKDAALIHTALSLRLMPDNDFAKLLLGRSLEQAGFYDKSLNVFVDIKQESVFWSVAQIRSAQVLSADKKDAEAIDVLQSALIVEPSYSAIKEQLADLLRSQEKFAEAVPLYTEIIDALSEESDTVWALYYSRGTCYEQLGQWDKAEQDLKKALALQPEQPFVLNYLGYSWVDKGINLEEALAMLHKAVDAEPENGFIIDSLGWAYYKIGKYDYAVKYLEKAVSVETSDPLINDHLGDAYLEIGRTNEARFQWSRALSFDPEEKDRKRIEEKLVR